MRMHKYLFAMAFPAMVALAQPAGAAKAEALVKQAVAFAKQNGVEKLFQETNNGNGKFHAAAGSDLYIFIYDDQGVCKAIGYNTGALVGKNRMDIKDPDGKFIVRDLVQVGKAKGKGWYDYKYPDPADNKIKAKTSYVERYEGLTIGAGIYK